MGLFRDKTIVDQVQNAGEQIQPELKDVFVGKRTIFSILGFVLGGVLLGNGLWTLLHEMVGTWITMGIGLVVFIAGGIASRAFRR